MAIIDRCSLFRFGLLFLLLESSLQVYGTTIAPSMINPISDGVLTNISPSYGPIAGGTSITITSIGVSNYDIVSIIFGIEGGSSTAFQWNGNTFVAVTPRVPTPGLVQIMVTFVLNGTSLFGSIDFTFRDDPIITDIYPRKHIAKGGTELTVVGQYLDSVALPLLVATVLVTIDVRQQYAGWNHNKSMPCSVVNSTMLTCIVPDITALLPPAFAELLNADAAINDTYPYASAINSSTSSVQTVTPAYPVYTTTPYNGAYVPPFVQNGTAARRRRRSVSSLSPDTSLVYKRFVGRYSSEFSPKRRPLFTGRYTYKSHLRKQSSVSRLKKKKSLTWMQNQPSELVQNQSTIDQRGYVSRHRIQKTSEQNRNSVSRHQFKGLPRKRRFVSRSSASRTIKATRQIRSATGVSYSAFLGPNGQDRADVYIGFAFDGDEQYQNISQVFPDFSFDFFPPPTITLLLTVIDFDPDTENSIQIIGSNFRRGALLSDYTVTISNSNCVDDDLTDNVLECSPQKVEPPLTPVDVSRCQDGSTHNVMVQVGYLQFEYACLRYIKGGVNVGLIVGLTVGLGVPILAGIILLIVCLLTRGQHISKPKLNTELDTREPPSAGQLELTQIASAKNNGDAEAPRHCKTPVINMPRPGETDVDIAPGEKPLYLELEAQDTSTSQTMIRRNGREDPTSDDAEDNDRYLDMCEEEYVVHNKYLEIL